MCLINLWFWNVKFGQLNSCQNSWGKMLPESGNQVKELKTVFAKQACYCICDWDTWKAKTIKKTPWWNVEILILKSWLLKPQESLNIMDTKAAPLQAHGVPCEDTRASSQWASRVGALRWCLQANIPRCSVGLLSFSKKNTLKRL